MRVLVGTSGYSYREWKGRFYPKQLKAAGMLAFYASRFRTVEINATFYRLPPPEQLAGWAREVPDGFTFALKAPRRITHIGRLANVAAPTKELLATAAALGTKLGPILFGLPPNMKRDVPRLVDFLAALPRGPRIAFELRHESWFDDATYAALAARGAALCIAEADRDAGLVTPLVATTDWGYLRLRKRRYGPKTLAAWADRLGAQRWSDAYVYFKHEDEGTGPRYAAQLDKLLA